MRSSIIAGFLALATSHVSAQFLNQSAPFNLYLRSSDPSLNGSALIACHEGAAIESLCVGAAVAGATPSVYYFNYSSSETPQAPIGIVGSLVWDLTSVNLSSPMQLAYNAASNVAVPLLTPSEDFQEIAFDSANLLAIPNYIDDRLTGSSTPYHPELYYRWYVCTTNVGYTYETLAWTLGDAPPQNPTCVKVDVVRVFI
jgi:hypothetical protein